MARDLPAANETAVGHCNVEKGLYLAGINRLKKEVTDYQALTMVPEALYRLAEEYVALSAPSEAQTEAAVLGHNCTNSDWY